jgi:hypothetical protein
MRAASAVGTEYANNSLPAIGGITTTRAIVDAPGAAVMASLTERLHGCSTSLGACCYKTYVRGKHKRLCIVLLFALLTFSIEVSCTSHVTRDDNSVEQSAQTADKADEEEVVEADESSSSTDSEEESESTQQKTTGIFMSIGYLAMTIGMTILPLLMM